MEVEENVEIHRISAEEASLIVGAEEVEQMVGLDSEDESQDDGVPIMAKEPRIWPEVSTEQARRFRREVDEIKEVFTDEQDPYDATMVSEYADDIFEYMGELEVRLILLDAGDPR